MRDKDLYAQILGIKSPWIVSRVELVLSAGEVTVHVEQAPGAKQYCPTCARVSPGYDSRPPPLAAPGYLSVQNHPGSRCPQSAVPGAWCGYRGRSLGGAWLWLHGAV